MRARAEIDSPAGRGPAVEPQLDIAGGVAERCDLLPLDAVILGQLGLWLYARIEGGVLSLPDYLGQTFGFLVPLQFAAAMLVAWWTAR